MSKIASAQAELAPRAEQRAGLEGPLPEHASQGDLDMTTPSTTRRRSLWPFLSLFPLGFGAWAVAYAGIRVRCTGLIALGGLMSASAIAGWILRSVYATTQWEHVLA